MATTQKATTTTKATKQVAGTLFTKKNHIWMAAAGALIILGFITMSGGVSSDPTKFNADEVYSTLRITVAPILILCGLGLFVYAIMKNGTDTSNTTN